MDIARRELKIILARAEDLFSDLLFEPARARLKPAMEKELARGVEKRVALKPETDEKIKNILKRLVKENPSLAKDIGAYLSCGGNALGGGALRAFAD